MGLLPTTTRGVASSVIALALIEPGTMVTLTADDIERQVGVDKESARVRKEKATEDAQFAQEAREGAAALKRAGLLPPVPGGTGERRYPGRTGDPPPR